MNKNNMVLLASNANASYTEIAFLLETEHCHMLSAICIDVSQRTQKDSMLPMHKDMLYNHYSSNNTITTIHMTQVIWKGTEVSLRLGLR